jgi:hypothetical protein
MKSRTASVSSSDSIPKTAKINLCPSSMRMSVPPVEWRSLAYTGVIFLRKKEPCTHHQVGRAGDLAGEVVGGPSSPFFCGLVEGFSSPFGPLGVPSTCSCRHGLTECNDTPHLAQRSRTREGHRLWD